MRIVIAAALLIASWSGCSSDEPNPIFDAGSSVDQRMVDQGNVDQHRGDGPRTDAEDPPDGARPETSQSPDGPAPDSAPDTICVPTCGGKTCGPDGCGDLCGVCPAAELCTSDGQCAAPVYPASGREVGVDYHATGADFLADSFLTRYHEPAVRSVVQAQLTGMAAAGATVISTRIWQVLEPGVVATETWRHHFPLSTQELDNVGLYAQDVAAAGLKLYLTTLYLWCADYHTGTPSTTLGQCNLTAAQFVDRVKQTISGVLDRVKGIHLPGGLPVVERFFLDGEMMTAASASDPATQWEKKNQRWFLKDSGLWSWFHSEVRRAGMIPTLYLIHASPEAQILDEVFTDATFPVLNKHRSMFWIYRTLKFLQDSGLPIPDRVDFSCYPKAEFTNPATMINRVFADYEATIPGLLGVARKDFFVAETFYQSTAFSREKIHKGFAAQYALRPGLRGVTFWTTPFTADSGGVMVAPPFDFSGLSDVDIIRPQLTNGTMEAAGGCGVGDGVVNPAGFCTEWANGAVSDWSIGQSVAGAQQGSQGLELRFGHCATSPCAGSAYPGIFVLSDAATGAAADRWAAVRLWGRYSGGDHAGRAILIDNATDTVDHLEVLQSSTFAEYMLLGKINSADLKLRLEIINPTESNTTMYVDQIH